MEKIEQNIMNIQLDEIIKQQNEIKQNKLKYDIKKLDSKEDFK